MRLAGEACEERAYDFCLTPLELFFYDDSWFDTRKEFAIKMASATILKCIKNLAYQPGT